MAAKRDQSKAGSNSKKSLNAGWATLTWDDLVDWAGERSVSRRRAYQKQERVDDVAIRGDDWLLATVTGGDRYAAGSWK